MGKKEQLFVLVERHLIYGEGKTELENIHLATNKVKNSDKSHQWMPKTADEGIRKKGIFTVPSKFCLQINSYKGKNNFTFIEF